MNNFSLSDLCCLFCFPPCPSSIAAKLAFLPPESSYVLTPLENASSNRRPCGAGNQFGGGGLGATQRFKMQIKSNQLNTDSLQDYSTTSCVTMPTAAAGISTLGPTNVPEPPCTSQRQIVSRTSESTAPAKAVTCKEVLEDCEQAEPFFVTTKRRNRIVCLHMKANVGKSHFTILYSHGNAVDLGQMCGFFSMLSACLNCDIFSYDYSGYGRSTGRPSEQNLYADADAAWNSLRNLFGVPADKIIIYGQSIGSVPSIDLASRYKCAGVVLHSPMVSGLRVACPGCTVVPALCDVFQSTSKIGKIKSFTLVIHGTNDEVIDMSHGITIFDRLKYPAEPLWVNGAGHNDIEMYDEFFQRIRRFIFEECHEHLKTNGVSNGSTGKRLPVAQSSANYNVAGSTANPGGSLC